ncbi:MAG: hypothetical protein WCJ31_00415 [Planctomycetia bacterium]
MDSERDTLSVGNPGRGRPLWQAKLGLAGWTLAGIGILSQAGCMSAITATTFREALRETAASLSSPHDLDHASTARVDRPVADAEAEDAENSPGDDAQLEQVIDNAVARLSAAGGIDTPTQELLIKTLEQTRPEDWAVVVNEFAKTLEASRGSIAADDAADGGMPARPRTGGVLELDIPARARSSADAPPPVAELAAVPVEPVAAVDLSGIPLLRVAPIVVAPAPADAAPLPEPTPLHPAASLPPQPINVVDLPLRPIAPEPAPAPVVVAALIEPAPTPAAPAELVTPQVETAAPMPPTPEAFELPPATATGGVIAPAGPVVSNACFATRVRGWGSVDRFPTAVFRPGQELIVYFELDRLQIRSVADGHTTGIDASFRLIDAGGERVGQWAFEPIVETCSAPRRDYFARYFIRIPEDAKPGRHRLEWSVTDTVAGASRQAHLDLDVVAE